MSKGARWASAGGDWPRVARSQFEPLRAQLTAGSAGVLLCGPAGIGKTCLARALSDSLTMPVTAFACSPGDSEIPLTALNTLLGGSGGLLPDSRDAAQERAREHLARIGGGRPVLVVGDDIQWLDEASAELLAALARSGDVQLLCTARSVRNLPHPVQRLIHDDELRRIEVTGFSADELVLLLEAVLGGAVDHALAEELVEVTGGNALFAREAIRSALAEGGIALQRGVWSSTGWRLPTGTGMADLVDAELDRVGERHRPVLELIALSGLVPRAEVLAGLDGDATADAIDALEDAGLVTVDRASGLPALRIAHPVYAERVRRRTPAARRRALHEQRYADVDFTTMAPGDFLRWTDWAVDSDISIAPEQLLRAATAAAALGQDRFALRMAESAVPLLPEDATMQRADALLLCAWQHLNLADWQEGLSYADRVIEVLRDADVDPTDKVLRLYGAYRVRGDVQQFMFDDVEAALATMDDYLEIEGAALFHDRVVGRARRLAWWGEPEELLAFLPRLEGDEPLSIEMIELVPPAITHLTWRGEIDRGLALSAKHWPAAEAAKGFLPWAIAELHTATAHAYTLSGRLKEVEEGDWLTLSGDVRQDHTVTRIGQAHFLGVHGRWDEAWTEMRAGVAQFEARDPSGLLHWAAAAAADVAVMAGKWAEASRLLDVVDQGATRISRGMQGDWGPRVVRASWGMGRPQAAERARDLATWAEQRDYHLVRLDALHLLALADPAMLKDHLDAAAPLPTGGDDAPVMAHLAAHVRAVIDGDDDMARAALVELARLGRWMPLGRNAPQLTKREREIARLVTAGLTSPEIAERLHVSTRTVETHVSRVMSKLGVSRRSEVGSALLP